MTSNEVRHQTQALLAADAASYMEQTGDLTCTGPSGTNSTDLLIACRA